MRNEQKILVGKTEGKRPPEISRSKWQKVSEVIKLAECEGVDGMRSDNSLLEN
jgi:hypothetical protein